jgi:hypothetical protein
MFIASYGNRASASHRRLALTRSPSSSALWEIVALTIHTSASPAALRQSPHVARARVGADSK